VPTVPAYGQQKVNRAALPGVRRTSSASTALSEGAGVGQAIADIGEQGVRLGAGVFGIIQERERQRADEIQNLKTLEAFNNIDHQYLYDQQKGFLTKQGDQVVKDSVQYVSDYNAAADQIGEGIKSERARGYYNQLKANRTDSFRNRVDQHSTTEYDKFENQQFNATMESSINAAIAAGASDLDTVKLQLNEQDQAIAAHGARLGMSSDAQQLLKDKSHAAVHAGVIENLVSQQKMGTAQAYFDETKDTIAKGDPNAVERIQKALEEGTALYEAQKATDVIMATFKNEQDARDAAKIQIKDPKTRQTALELIEHEFNIRDQQQQQAHKDLTLKGLNIVEKTGTWTSIPPNEWAQYTVGERDSIKEYLRAKAAGTTVKTDPNVWATLMTAAHSDDPQVRDAFVKANPLSWVGALSPSDWQEAMRLQSTIKKDANTLAASSDSTQTRMVNEALGYMGLPPNPIEPGKEKFDKDTYDRVGAYRRSVREAISRVEAATGKKATDAEVQSVVDELRTKVGKRTMSTGRLWNTYGDAYAFEVAQAQAHDAADIPPTEKRMIDDALRSKGLPVDDAHRLELFNVRLSLTRKDR